MFRKIFFFIVFFLTGFSSLVYEIIWVRQLSLIFGSTVYAVSVVLAAFMGGLALGSFYFGKLADRSKNVTCLFALTQIGTGITAFVISIIIPRLTALYPFILKNTLPATFLISALSFVFTFTLILIPTIFIGGTFPLMVKMYIKLLDRARVDLGNIYAINTIGSVIGVLATGFLLISLLGLSKTVLIAALFNLTLGIIFYLIKMEKSEPRSAPAEVKSRPHPGNLLNILIFAIGLSGFAALGYEVIWARILSIFFQNTVYSFSIILASFLSGIAIGSYIFSRFIAKIKNNLLTLVLLELFLGLFVLILLQILPELPAIVLKFTRGAEMSWVSATIFQFTILFFIFLPATIIMGIIFPMVLGIVAQNLGSFGQKVGLVYSANTTGAIIGSLTAGFILIPLLGIYAGNKILAWLNILIGLSILLIYIRPLTRSILSGAASLIVLSLIFTLIKGNLILPPSIKLGLNSQLKLLFYKETLAGTVTVAENKSTGVRSCFINNSAVCGTTYDALKAVRMLGSLPILLHRDPQDILVIGFGIGITTATIAQFNVDRIDCVEICPAVAEASRFFADYNQQVLRNPKVNLIEADGRNFLLLSKKRYDVISCDPTHPLLGCGSLYTKEYFTLCRAKMKPGGIVCQYLPLHKISLADFESIIKSFNEVFPNTTIWMALTHGIMLGRLDSAPIDYSVFSQRLDNNRLNPLFEFLNFSPPVQFLSTFIMDEATVLKFIKDAKINTDDLPMVEFSGSRSLNKETWSTNMMALLNFRCEPSSIVNNLDEENRLLLQQYQAGKYFMYRGLVNQSRGLINEAQQDFYQGISINPEDEELQLMLRTLYPY